MFWDKPDKIVYEISTNLRVHLGDEMRLVRLWITGITMLLLCLPVWSQQSSGRRKIIIDQDASGPGGSDQQAILSLIQSPQTEVLGITVVTGDAWLKEEVAHALRTLEIIGRTDIPVVAGAGYPLVRRKEETELWEQEYGSIPWLGAWTPRRYHPADQLGEMPEGKPTTKPADEDAAHFLLRMVRKYPHEVTIYEGAPMTNLALAISIDPEFASLAKELVFMGGSASPKTNDPEFVNTPRHEFNFWFDPEAAHIVLRAPWKKARLHDGGHFCEDSADSGLAQPDQGEQYTRGSLRRLLYACVWRLQLFVGRTRGDSVARSECDHCKGDTLPGCRSQPRRQLWKHSELVRAGQTDQRGPTRRDTGRSGYGEVLQHVRRSNDGSHTEALEAHGCNCWSICLPCGWSGCCLSRSSRTPRALSRAPSSA